VKVYMYFYFTYAICKMHIILSLLMAVHNVPCLNVFLNLVFHNNYPTPLTPLKFFSTSDFSQFFIPIYFPDKTINRDFTVLGKFIHLLDY
jgi:hypothetical protein